MTSHHVWLASTRPGRPEKAIKASLLFLQTGFPKTHNLGLLTELLPEDWRSRRDQSELVGLSDWAIEPRYPGDVPEATEEDAKSAIEQARKVYETTLEDIEGHGYILEDEQVRGESAEEEED